MSAQAPPEGLAATSRCFEIAAIAAAVMVPGMTLAAISTTTLTVSATVISSCAVIAPSAADGGAVTVSCNDDSPYRVSVEPDTAADRGPPDAAAPRRRPLDQRWLPNQATIADAYTGAVTVTVSY